MRTMTRTDDRPRDSYNPCLNCGSISFPCNCGLDDRKKK
jgi:hypothetical protein